MPLVYHRAHPALRHPFTMQAVRSGARLWSCYDNTTVTTPRLGEHIRAATDCNCNGATGAKTKLAYPFQVLDALGQQALLRQFANSTMFFNEGPLAQEPLWTEALQYVSPQVAAAAAYLVAAAGLHLNGREFGLQPITHSCRAREGHAAAGDHHQGPSGALSVP
jgi:hypothetical protein